MKEPKKSKAREIAKTQYELLEKLEILEKGELSAYPEANAYSLAKLGLSNALQGELLNAIETDDHAFFERLAAIAKDHKLSKGKIVKVDDLGSRVVEAAALLDFDNIKITVSNVTKVMNNDEVQGKRFEFYATPDGGYDDRQIRTVMESVGLIHWMHFNELQNFMIEFERNYPHFTPEEKRKAAKTIKEFQNIFKIKAESKPKG